MKLIPDPNVSVRIHQLKRSTRKKYCLVIAVINEGERIRVQLNKLKKYTRYIDIIIIDGGSTDGSLTFPFLKKCKVKYLICKSGSGKLGTQLRLGFAFALKQDYPYIISMDGNNKDGVSAIPAFIRKLESGFDYIQGSRFLPQSQSRNTPFDRLLAIRYLHVPLCRLASGFKYTDSANGFRAFATHILKNPSLNIFRPVFSGYNLQTYLTVMVPRLGYRTTEIPVIRNYPKNKPAPTKISGILPKLAFLKEILEVVIGRYDTNQANRGSQFPVWQKIAVTISLFTFIVIGLYVRVSGLKDYAFSPDDLLHIHIAYQPSLFEVIRINSFDTNAPLMYIILNLLFRTGLPVSFSRVISLIPGILLIPLSWFLGHRYFNWLTGLCLASIVTFSPATVIMSQVIRPYTLALFFFAMSLLVLKSSSFPDKKSILTYIALTGISVSLCYPFILPVSVIGLVIITKTGRRLTLFWIIAHAPLFLLMFLFYIYQLKTQWSPQSVHYIGATREWLSEGFIKSWSAFFHQLMESYRFFTLPVDFMPVMSLILTGWGTVLLIGKRNFFLVTVYSGTFLLTLVLSFLDLYPFSASRHLLHLYLPFLLLILTPLYHLFKKMTPVQEISSFLVILLLTGIAASYSESVRYYRDNPSITIGEFPLKSASSKLMQQQIALLTQNPTVILTDRYSALYLMYWKHTPHSYRLLLPVINQFRYINTPVFFTADYGTHTTLAQYAKLYEIYKMSPEYAPDRKILLLTSGWGSYYLFRESQTPEFSRITEASFSHRPDQRSDRFSLFQFSASEFESYFMKIVTPAAVSR